MKRSTLFSLIVLMALCLLGCQPQEIVIPTVAQLPTITPTFTPTFTPTDTPTPTETFTPTATFTSTASPTDTPTDTVTPSDTPTPTDTFTPTDTPTWTPTATFTPIATDTPTYTITPAGPSILSFTADNYQVVAGGVTILRWTTVADTATLEQLNQQGSVVNSWIVPPNGQQAVTVQPNQGRMVTFRLTAIRLGISVTQSLSVTVVCQYQWFFGDQYAANACPANVAAVGDGKFYEFERGLMIFAAASSESYPGNRFYVLLYAGNQWQAFQDPSTAGGATGSPPAGLYLPRGDMGRVWENRNHNGQAIKTLLGYARTDRPDTGVRTIQVELGGAAVYINAPNGAVYRLSGASSGTYTQVR
ncbi:MAG: hypothetical protein JW910_02120 [Anaerolineae bacterium]|nr:hypothetical protein [Anaerolineae bacterium]